MHMSIISIHFVELEIKPSLNAKLIPSHVIQSAASSASNDGASGAQVAGSDAPQLEPSATPADK